MVENSELASRSRRSSKKASFRARLEANGDRPFDQEEFQFLMSKMCAQTPLKKDRQLRGVIKTYEGDEMGRSYFDHYPG